MKIVDKLYVGFQKDRYADDENQRLLGFAVPEGETATIKKRKSTVDKWRQKDIPPIILENKPRYGFKIVDTVSRYSTSNKLFRVFDPAGFELEISADNLFSIINQCTISKGLIADEMIWSGKSLVSTNSEEYKLYKNPAKAAKNDTGNWMKHLSGNIFYRYEGKFNAARVETGITRLNPPRYSYYNKNDLADVPRSEVSYDVRRKNDKTLTVYTQWTYNDANEQYELLTTHIRKSYFKDLIPLDSTDAPPPDYELPLGKMIDKTTSQMGRYNSKFWLFKNKKDMMEADFSVEILKNNINVWKGNEGYYGTDISFTVWYDIDD